MGKETQVTSEELEEVHHGIKRLIDIFELPPNNGNIGNSQINIQASGIGISICITACLVMLVICFGIGFLYLDQSRKLDRLQDTETVILQYAPQMLRDKVNHKDGT